MFYRKNSENREKGSLLDGLAALFVKKHIGLE
jgi:hypothetical protein